MASLYDRLGGAGAIEAATDLLYKKLYADPVLSQVFTKPVNKKFDINKQKSHMRAFLTMGNMPKYLFSFPSDFETHPQRLRLIPFF